MATMHRTWVINNGRTYWISSCYCNYDKDHLKRCDECGKSINTDHPAVSEKYLCEKCAGHATKSS